MSKRINPKIRAYMRDKAEAVLRVLDDQPSFTPSVGMPTYAQTAKAEDRRIRELAEMVIQLCDEAEADS